MRGYKNAVECAEHQIQKINERVGVDDILWNLGDNFLNASDEQCKKWWGAIKCRNIKYLFGNHESCPYRRYKERIHEQYGLNDVEVYPLKYSNIEFLGNHQEIQIGKQQIVMNHFPLRIWHNDSRAAWMLSGHSHLQDKGRRPEAEYQKALDVGWDYKNDVWSFSEIEDVMSTKSIQILDHNRSH
jgi:calcineurin-like phosphoesterase family protein